MSFLLNQSLLGKIIRLLLSFIPPNSVFPIFSGKMVGKKWIVGSGNHGCWLGTYEYRHRQLIEQLVPEGGTFFDIGAHVGFYTLLASILVGENGKVVAFEPLPRNIYFLKEHVRLNRLANVSIIEAAVSDSTGYATFSEGPDNFIDFTEFSNGSDHSMAHFSPIGNLTVKTVSLDELHLQGEVPPPNFLKIDVEGADALVLKGAKKVLATFHPTIFLSIHGERNRRDCFSLLQGMDYSLRPIIGNDISTSNEILATYSS